MFSLKVLPFVSSSFGPSSAFFRRIMHVMFAAGTADPDGGFVELLQVNSREADHADHAKRAMATANESTSFRNFKYWRPQKLLCRSWWLCALWRWLPGHLSPLWKLCQHLQPTTSWYYCFVWMHFQREVLYLRQVWWHPSHLSHTQHLRWEYIETKQLRYCEADTSAERARSLTPGRGLGDVTGAHKTATSPVGLFSDASLLFDQKKKIFAWCRQWLSGEGCKIGRFPPKCRKSSEKNRLTKAGYISTEATTTRTTLDAADPKTDPQAVSDVSKIWCEGEALKSSEFAAKIYSWFFVEPYSLITTTSQKIHANIRNSVYPNL